MLPLVVWIYALAMIGLGAFAYFADKSVMSLVGGGLLGLLAIAGVLVAASNATVGYAMVAISTLGAMGRFAKPLFSEQKWYPAGLIFGLAAITFICLVVGHFASRADR